MSGYIVITSNPITPRDTFAEQIQTTELLEIPKNVIRANGWFWEYRFTIPGRTRTRALEFLNNGPGRAIKVYNAQTNVDFEGIVNTVILDTGATVERNTLADVGNKVWGRRIPVGGGVVTRSNTYENGTSQNRYGVKSWVVTMGEVRAATANQWAQIVLDERAFPAPKPDQLRIGQPVSGPELTFICIGWARTLGWLAYNQTVNLGEVNANVVVSDIIGDADVGQFIKSSTVETNTTQFSREHDADRTPLELLESIATFGDSSLNPWVFGMNEDRHFYYQEARGPQDFYVYNLHDPERGVSFKGKRIDPNEIRPDFYIHMEGATLPSGVVPATAGEDIKKQRIIETTTGPEGTVLKFDKSDFADIIIARAAGGKA
jgi:hypothetical protein